MQQERNASRSFLRTVEEELQRTGHEDLLRDARLALRAFGSGLAFIERRAQSKRRNLPMPNEVELRPLEQP